MTNNRQKLLGPIYSFNDYVENLENYSKGGFHPVEIDDEIHNGRYRIVHKLGYGSYSTVWLARDQLENRFVSLKFAVAYNASESSETQILRKLSAPSSNETENHPERSFVLDLLDEFEVQGPNGTHHCMVTEALGPTLADVKDELDEYRLPISIARNVAIQCAKALEYIHSCGIAHGDLHQGNILFKIPGLDSWTIEQVYENFGEPRKEEIKREDGQPLTSAAPRYTVRPPKARKLLHLCITDECSIRIVDFGEAFFAAGEGVAKELNTPPAIAAPEIMFRDETVSATVDIWAFGCLLYSIFSDHTLIDSFFGSRDQLLFEVVRTLGRMPERWWHKWEKREMYFEENGAFKPEYEAQGTRSLKTRIARIVRGEDGSEMEEFETQDLTVLERVLEGTLRYEPTERIHAEEVLRELSTAWGPRCILEKSVSEIPQLFHSPATNSKGEENDTKI